MTTATLDRRVDSKTMFRKAIRSAPGRLALVAVFTALLGGLRCAFWWQTGLCLALTSLFPQQRKLLIFLAAACWVVLSPPVDVAVLKELAGARAAVQWVRWWPMGIAIVWGLAWAQLWTMRRFPKLPTARRPVTCLLAILVVLLAASRAALAGPAWIILAATSMALAHYIWFFAYWLSENAAADRDRPLPRTGYCRPFWGFTNVPFGKGAAYLERAEARDDEQLAVVQLKALRLILWTVALTGVLVLTIRFVYGMRESLTSIPREAPDALIPTYWMALERQIHGHPYSWSIRWLALILQFLLQVLTLTVFGHTVVAICRMAGFNIFRNTYRPLSSTSIAEFYNRIYYYFKELLVAFFFFPTYLRYFKRHPRLRLFAATLAAAGLGNFLYHYLRDTRCILRLGLWESLVFYRSYAVYSLLLGLAIGLSQLRMNAHETLPDRLAQNQGCRRGIAVLRTAVHPGRSHPGTRIEALRHVFREPFFAVIDLRGTTMDKRARVRDYIAAILRDNADDADELRDSDSLVLSGRLSSLDLVGLLAFLESAFSYSIDPVDFDQAKFDSVNRILALLETGSR